MTQSGGSWCWPFRLTAAFGIGGAMIALTGDCALTQIKPDTTLGSERSVLKRNVLIDRLPSDRIEGGARRGANLFHSFQEFNIKEGQGAYFSNPAGIENILGRVTGKNRSDIEGTLGVLGKANLFLMNPNGIIFGPNASLDVRGSFVATTANAMRLGDAGLFSASEPATSNLLTVRPSALFFNALATQRVVNQSQTQSLRRETNSLGGPIGLQVPTGQTLALVGGNVLLEGGNLTAAGGRIELGSVAGVGEVRLSQSGNQWSLGYDQVNAFGDIRLGGGALVDASGAGGGNLQIQGARLEMTQGSYIVADTLGSGDGGEVLVRTTEAIALSDSFIYTNVFGSGTGGDLTIATERLTVQDGGRVLANTFGTGDGGTLSVTATDAVEVIGTSADDQFFSGLFAQALGDGDAGTLDGNAGDLTIATGRLTVRDGAQVSAGTPGTGASGTLSVTATDAVEVIGTSADGQFASGLFAQTQGDDAAGTLDGNAGDLTIATGRLTIQDGAQVSASTFGTGAGGTLSVTATDAVEVIGTSADDQFGSALSTQTQGDGDAGTLDGNAGDLTIATGRLTIQDGAQVSASTFGTGAGGDLNVTADVVEVIGTSADGQFASGLGAQAGDLDAGTLDGNAGDLTIATGRLTVRDGALVSLSTRGTGNAGNLNVTADAVEVIGTSADGQFISGLFTQTQGKGNANNLTIATGRLTIQNGAQVSASTFGTGNAGNLNVTADAVEVIGTSADGQFASGLTAQTRGKGDAGNLTIATGRLTVQDGAGVTVSITGLGDAGNLDVAARSIYLDEQATLSSETAAGEGDIDLRSQDLILSRGSKITTDATETATGGNINIDTGVLVALENSDIRANALAGPGGQVSISSQGIFGTQYRLTETSESDITASSELGPEFSGTVDLNTPDVDPSEGLVALPEEVVDVSGLIAQTCPAGSGPRQSKFVVTGRGGLPPNPGETLSTDAVQVDLVTLNPEVDKSSAAAVPSSPTSPASTPMVEAQGWVKDAKGNVVLTANATTVEPHSSWQKNANCQKQER